jgi:hypothetical protein
MDLVLSRHRTFCSDCEIKSQRAHPLISHHAGLWSEVNRRAYFYREVAIGTLMFGIYLHVSRFVFGDELLLQHLLKPVVDEALAIPMTYAAIAGLAGWKQLRFRTRADRMVSRVILGFIIVSVPIHVATFFGASMSRYTAFPMWYSLVEAAFLFPAFGLALARIQYAASGQS